MSAKEAPGAHGAWKLRLLGRGAEVTPSLAAAGWSGCPFWNTQQSPLKSPSSNSVDDLVNLFVPNLIYSDTSSLQMFAIFQSL